MEALRRALAEAEAGLGSADDALRLEKATEMAEAEGDAGEARTMECARTLAKAKALRRRMGYKCMPQPPKATDSQLIKCVHRPSGYGAPLARFVCFTGMAGKPSNYSRWGEALGDELGGGVEVFVTAWPGREEREHVPTFKDFWSAFAAIVEVVQPLCKRSGTADDPQILAFHGHSQGCTFAYETARELQRRGVPLPDAMFLASCPPPWKQPAAFAKSHVGEDDDVDEQELIDSLAETGLPRGLFMDPKFRAKNLPLILADRQLMRGYHRTSPGFDGQVLGWDMAAGTCEARLTCRVVSLGGKEDSTLWEDDLIQWRRVCADPGRNHAHYQLKVSGAQLGHNFWMENKEGEREMLRVVGRELRHLQALRGGPRTTSASTGGKLTVGRQELSQAFLAAELEVRAQVEADWAQTVQDRIKWRRENYERLKKRERELQQELGDPYVIDPQLYPIWGNCADIAARFGDADDAHLYPPDDTLGAL